jgi:hypothetical protein
MVWTTVAKLSFVHKQFTAVSEARTAEALTTREQTDRTTMSITPTYATGPLS